MIKYLLLLSTDFNVSAQTFTRDDLQDNLNAAVIISRCIIGDSNPYQWDSSVSYDIQLWTGHELQLFMYGLKLAQQHGHTEYIRMFEDLVNAYSIDENTAMERPRWTFSWTLIDAHRSYLMQMTKTPLSYTSQWGRVYQPQMLPVPLLDCLKVDA